MGKFLTSNETVWRLARTIVQGILGVLVANIDMIVGAYVLEPQTRALIVALVFVYILMGYQAGRQQHRLTDTKKEMLDAKFRYMTIS